MGITLAEIPQSNEINFVSSETSQESGEWQSRGILSLPLRNDFFVCKQARTVASNVEYRLKGSTCTNIAARISVSGAMSVHDLQGNGPAAVPTEWRSGSPGQNAANSSICHCNEPS